MVVGVLLLWKVHKESKREYKKVFKKLKRAVRNCNEDEMMNIISESSHADEKLVNTVQEYYMTKLERSSNVFNDIIDLARKDYRERLFDFTSGYIASLSPELLWSGYAQLITSDLDEYHGLREFVIRSLILRWRRRDDLEATLDPYKKISNSEVRPARRKNMEEELLNLRLSLSGCFLY